ncbi:MAG: PQQ-dependent sugar dehydrogenase, partial [Candidatus Shapirobacteria bacterium]
MKQKNILIYVGIVMVAMLIIYFFLLPTPLSNPMKKSEAINLELVADKFVSPIKLLESPNNSGRLFVTDQTGLIKIIKDGQVLDEPFLDLRKNMVKLKESYDERGLLGIAFSPNFENDKKFYVYYSAPLRKNGPQGWDHTSRISEFKVSNDNQDKADLNSEKIILEIDEPQFNHNGGEIIFGSDGYLYVAVGDGGNADDFGLGHSKTGNAQDLSNLLGKILRIKTDGGIPEDNPFVGKTGRDEIYAYGFRNPF